MCLYGYKSAGFQSLNAFYRKEVRKSFNDVSQFDLSAECYVEVALTISNGHSEDDYVLKREWKVFSEKLEDFESFIVVKNGAELSEEEMGQFDNYLLNIIPPELFDLFFELKDATFIDIKFEEIKIVVNTDFSNIKYMIIAPLAIKAENVKMENVKFSGTIEFKKVPNCEIETVIDNFWYKEIGDISVDSNTVINFTDITKTETSLD